MTWHVFFSNWPLCWMRTNMKILERLLLACLNKQITKRYHTWSLLITEELKMPSSKQSLENLTQFSLVFFVWISWRQRWSPQKYLGLMSTWQKDHRLWDWRIVCPTRWSAAPEHHRGLYYYHSCFNLYTSNFQYQSDTCHLQQLEQNKGEYYTFQKKSG